MALDYFWYDQQWQIIDISQGNQGSWASRMCDSDRVKSVRANNGALAVVPASTGFLVLDVDTFNGEPLDWENEAGLNLVAELGTEIEREIQVEVQVVGGNTKGYHIWIPAPIRYWKAGESSAIDIYQWQYKQISGELRYDTGVINMRREDYWNDFQALDRHDPPSLERLSSVLTDVLRLPERKQKPPALTKHEIDSFLETRIDGALDQIRSAPTGRRRDVFNRTIFSLAKRGLKAEVEQHRDQFFAAYHEVAPDNPVAETEATFQGALNDGDHAFRTEQVVQTNVIPIANDDSISLDQVETKEIEWLWQDMIPRGMISILAGKAGCFKSTLALTIAAQLTRAPYKAHLPNRKASLARLTDQQCNVGFYGTEDSLEHIIAPRLRLAGVKPERVKYYPASFSWTNEEAVKFFVRRAIRHDLDLLIIDPFMALLEGKNNNDPSQIRAQISRLTPLLDSGCAVLGIHHERKDKIQGEAAVDRVMGSQAWTAVARSVMQVAVINRKQATEEAIANDMGQGRSKFGMLAVTKTNIAEGNVGYHYEAEIVDGHPVIEFGAVQHNSPESLLAAYSPKVEERVRAIDQKAQADMQEETEEVLHGMNAVEQILTEQGNMRMDELIPLVQEVASVSARSAITAIRRKSESKRIGENWVRSIKS